MVHFQYPALMGDAVAAFAFVANPGLATAAVAALDEEAVFAENAHHQSAHFQYPVLTGGAVVDFAFVADLDLAAAAVAAPDEEAVFAENAHHQSAHFQCPVLMENAAAVAAVFSPASGHDEDRRALFHFCQNHPT